MDDTTLFDRSSRARGGFDGGRPVTDPGSQAVQGRCLERHPMVSAAPCHRDVRGQADGWRRRLVLSYACRRPKLFTIADRRLLRDWRGGTDIHARMVY